jgi:hypothetical protein
MVPNEDYSTGASAPLFLHIPIARLILLSIASCGLYEMYWIYKNWRYIKEREGLNIRPFWRGIFGIFFCHSLLRRIHDDTEARAAQNPSFPPGRLATGWVILVILANIIGRAPGPLASIISFVVPSYLLFVPVQNHINAGTQKINPTLPHYKWSSGHIICLVIGLLIWTMTLLAAGAEY